MITNLHKLGPNLIFSDLIWAQIGRIYNYTSEPQYIEALRIRKDVVEFRNSHGYYGWDAFTSLPLSSLYAQYVEQGKKVDPVWIRERLDNAHKFA